MDGRDMLTVPDVARLLGLHVESVRRLVREGRLPAFKAGRSWRFDRTELAAWREQQRSSPAGQRILVVEDSDAVRDAVRIAVEEMGYEVVAAATAAGGLAALQNRLPDLILLDLQLPEGSGVDVIREVRSRDPDLPVIIITGYPDSDLMHRALKYSPLLVMEKPVDLNALMNAVRRTLKQ